MEALILAVMALAGLALAIRHIRENLNSAVHDEKELRGYVPAEEPARPKPPPEIIKTVSGRKFWEDGYETGSYSSDPSNVPRWFVDLRSQGRIRVNCLTQATIYLRNDGRLYHIQKAYSFGRIDPIWEAIDGDKKRDKFINGVFKREKVSTNSEDIWECCEYIPDADCFELDNIWRVAAAARRTGRFLYTARRKTAKAFLEDPSAEVPWIYAEKFDQSTAEYEARYQEKIKRIAQERLEREEYSRKNARYVEIDLGGKSTDHYRVLGIEKTAGPSEIKRAYWAKAKKCHPDLNPKNKEAEEEFKTLSISYAELMRAYD